MCGLCHRRGWFFYQHWNTKVYEIRHCDQCQLYSNHHEAGKAAAAIIAEKLRIAEVMTETRLTDEWSMDTIPCSVCLKKGWHIKENREGTFQLLHCHFCKIIGSDPAAADMALSQIAEAFNLVDFAEDVRQDDEEIKNQTAKAFGEIEHQWMVKDRRHV